MIYAGDLLGRTKRFMPASLLRGLGKMKGPNKVWVMTVWAGSSSVDRTYLRRASRAEGLSRRSLLHRDVGG
jgi:hypothetical protein